jgi:hypothetical protein
MAQIFFICMVMLGFTIAAAGLLSSFIYDLSLAKVNKKASDHPYARAFRKRPNILIVISLDANPAQLKNCLRSIVQNNYRKYEIIINNKLNEPTRGTVDAFKKQYPSKKIIAENGWQKFANKADIIVEMSGEQLLAKNALAETVKYFALNENVDVLTAHTENIFDYSLSSLMSRYEYVLKNQWQKALSVLFRANKTNVRFKTYRYKNKKDHIYFCSNIRVYEPRKFFTSQKNKFAAGLSSAGFILLSYLIYTAANAHYSTPLELVWCGGCFYLILNIWSDEHISFVKKFRMSILTPMISVLFYLKLPLNTLRQLASF